jgi:hypothetical protein
MRDRKKPSLYNWPDVHNLYENQARFSMSDSRNPLPDMEIKIFYFFWILSLTMFTFGRAKATKRRLNGLTVGQLHGKPKIKK